MKLRLELQVFALTAKLQSSEGEDEVEAIKDFIATLEKESNLRPGRQSERDSYLKTKSKDFQRWFHKSYKQKGDPDLSNSDIDRIEK